jgi:hypothetical protein
MARMKRASYKHRKATSRLAAMKAAYIEQWHDSLDRANGGWEGDDGDVAVHTPYGGARSERWIPMESTPEYVYDDE